MRIRKKKIKACKFRKGKGCFEAEASLQADRGEILRGNWNSNAFREEEVVGRLEKFL